MKFRRYLLMAVCALAVQALPCAYAGDAVHSPDDEARAIAEDAYLYAYPLLVMDAARRLDTNVVNADVGYGSGAPLNQFTHMSRPPDALLHDIPYPDPDMLWSTLWFDVSKEPLIIDVPPAAGRYYLVSLADMWSDVFASLGTRTTGGDRHAYAIAAPDWHGVLPKNVELLKAPTAAGLLTMRVRVDGQADAKVAQAFQAAFTATPLSRWGKKYQEPAGTYDIAMSRQPPAEQVAAMSAADFLAQFADLAGKYPPHGNDMPILARLQRLGFEPGRRFELARAPANLRAAVEAGIQAARTRVRSPPEPWYVRAGGWAMPLKPRGSYGTDYTLRARMARVALVSHLSDDLIDVRTSVDADGQPLDGAFRYELRFDRGQLPPVHAFWSLTLYNDRCELVDNGLNRYAMGTRNAPMTAPEGSTTMYIQYAAPIVDKTANWLPSPQSGHFWLELRLYWPRRAAVDGGWRPPEIRRVP